MGGTKSKEEKNKYLQEIGARAMKKNPFTFLICTKINLTNDVIVTKSPSDPNENYDGRIWINLIPVESYSPSRWNRFAKIVQVTKEEYNKWK